MEIGLVQTAHNNSGKSHEDKTGGDIYQWFVNLNLTELGVWRYTFIHRIGLVIVYGLFDGRCVTFKSDLESAYEGRLFDERHIDKNSLY